MNTMLKSSLILLALSSFALAQNAPVKTQGNSPKTQTAAPVTSGANSNAGQHDAAANKNSGTHTGNMVGNHKDVMEAVDKNSSSHSGGMSGNHKDMMGTAPNPSAGKTTKSDPNSPR